VNARVLVGLLVPADAGRPLALRPVRDSAAAISDLLGGVLLDDAVIWNVGGGVGVSVYWAEDRAGLPVNQRLSVLVTRLGIVDRTFHAVACGDALLLGATRQGRDVDLPGWVAGAADRCGYTVVCVTSPDRVLPEATATGSAGRPGAAQPGTHRGRRGPVPE
jgi:hypothetical protein